MEFAFVAVGGALGGLARFILGRRIGERAGAAIPVGTLLINILGAFLLGLVFSMPVNDSILVFAGEGFLGAFTTFSTFMYEGFCLFQDKDKKNAVFYIISTLILGIIGFIIGICLNIN